MKTGFFSKLAFAGMIKNKKIYLPYLLTCVSMVMMFYIMEALSDSPHIKSMSGGSTLQIVLNLGTYVIALFALLFLTYTNSFLARRRNREFGLYNVLGMDKKGIARIIVRESLFTTLIGLGGGMVLGILFFKFAELGLLRTIRREVDYRLTVSVKTVVSTLIVFSVIFLFLLLKSLWQVVRSKPLELFKSENAGEKPPKANWVLALGGGIILTGAYYAALSIKSPLSALVVFFAAVLMVILATYLLFCAGSVALCKLLQKSKSYYYKKNHFISVSSMIYRMKRNGAGLASICVLSTMVLVMISSSACLYVGAEDSLRHRYPYDVEIAVHMQNLANLKEERISQIRKGYQEVFAKENVVPKRTAEYSYAVISGLLQGTVLEVDSKALSSFGMDTYDDLRQLFFISQEDYNRQMGTAVSLVSGQAMLGTLRCEFHEQSLSVGGLNFDIVGNIEECPSIGEATMAVVSSIILVVPDYDVLTPLDRLADYNGNKMLSLKWYFGYDLESGDLEKGGALKRGQIESLYEHEFLDIGTGYGYLSSVRENERDDFYMICGGLFFLGIVLSTVFLFATVLIIYYKQTSEGYEDQGRFEIMKKIGMTAKDIKGNINSQVRTVFFAPLCFAGLHLAVAFPLIWKLLQLFNFRNLNLMILVTVGSFLVFGVFYVVIYKMTANTYYRIVNGGQKE